MTSRYRPGLPAATVLTVAAPAHADGPAPAVSGVNGKVSSEAGVTGSDGASSAVGVAAGSITTPLGHAFGLQLDGRAGTAFLTFGPWGGYHEVVDNTVGITARSGLHADHATIYPPPDLALSIGAGSQFNRANGFASLEVQPDPFARHNVAFFVDGALAAPSACSVTAAVRPYFGPDKPLIRRHREDDPGDPLFAAAAAWDSLANELDSTASGYQNVISRLAGQQRQGPGSAP